jgi:hypothetical protein
MEADFQHSTVTRNDKTNTQPSPVSGCFGGAYFFPVNTTLSATPPNAGFSCNAVAADEA